MTWPNSGNKPDWGFLQWSGASCQIGTIAQTAKFAHINYGDANKTSRPAGKIINLGGFMKLSELNMTKYNELKARFDAATSWMGNGTDVQPYFHIGTFLLSEEHWSPLFSHNDKRILMSSWDRSGSFTLGSGNVPLQLINTWAANNGYTGWSFTASDSIVKKWNDYYFTQLLKAWHEHMRLNGKEAGFLGAGWAGYWQFGMKYSNERSNFFPGTPTDEDTPWGYLIQNYDLIYCYQYPQDLSGIPTCIDEVKTIRDAGYQGKIAYITTSHFPEYGGSFSETVATAEYAAVAPYVNYIVSYRYVNYEADCLRPAILQRAWANYNPSGGCPPLSASLTMIHGEL